MITIVDNFKPTNYITQDNKEQFIVYDDADYLVIGGTCRFAFEFDGFSIDDILEAEFMYKESLSLMFLKKYSADELVIIEPSQNHIVVYSTLVPVETSQFKGNRTVNIQVKFRLKNNSIVYGEKEKLVVVSPLDRN